LNEENEIHDRGDNYACPFSCRTDRSFNHRRSSVFFRMPGIVGGTEAFTTGV
jgi:hypothetical protein